MCCDLRANIFSDPNFLWFRCLDPALSHPAKSWFSANIGVLQAWPAPLLLPKFLFNWTLLSVVRLESLILLLMAVSVWNATKKLWHGKHHPDLAAFQSVSGCNYRFFINKTLCIWRSGYFLNCLVYPQGLRQPESVPQRYWKGREKCGRGRCI